MQSTIRLFIGPPIPLVFVLAQDCGPYPWLVRRVMIGDLPLETWESIHIYASMNIKDLEAAADQVSNLMGLLSNRNRLLILCQLVEGEKMVGELARLLELREPAVSQQLAILRRERIVDARREGQSIHYRLARGDVSKLITFLYETYCGESGAANC